MVDTKKPEIKKVFEINEQRPQSYTVILTNEVAPRIPIVFAYEEVPEQN